MKYQSNVVDILKIKSGQSLYTWIAYANADGVAAGGALVNPTDFSTTDSSNRAYMGIAYNKQSSTESNDPNDYKWTKTQGQDGASGSGYLIETNRDEIKRFYEGTNESGKNIVSYSPNELSITARNNKNEIIDFTSSGYSLQIEVYSFGSDIGSVKNLVPTEFVTYNSDNLNYLFKWQEFVSSRTIGLNFESDPIIVQISLLKDSQIVASKTINCDWALSDEYAKFAVTATKIQASVDEAGLSFSSDGLTIKNTDKGGLHIIHVNEDGSETEVLNANTDGSAYFAGQINALSGNIGDVLIENGGLSYSNFFKLDANGLVANKGSLGDLDVTGKIVGYSGYNKTNDTTIVEGKKYYTFNDGTYQLVENPEEANLNSYYEREVGFSLDGTTGEIIANNITLGNAKLSQYLKLGDNCWIFNPDYYSYANADLKDESRWKQNSFINVNYLTSDRYKTALAINKDGTIQLAGETSESSPILLDGVNGQISGSNWNISPNMAEFNNIIAHGSIKSSVLEYGETQTIGGIMLVRPSSIIRTHSYSGNTHTVTLENSRDFNIGDYCQIENSGAEPLIVQISNKDNNTLTFNSDSTLDLVGGTMVDFGSRNSKEDLVNNASYGIGINASTNSALIPEQSFSLLNFYYDAESNKINRENRIILGKIPSGTEYGSIQNQYGLYADNVLVKGKLVSGTGVEPNDTVSGIDSLSTSGIPESLKKYFDKKDGNIIFWAGAKGNDVLGAPFWVDSYGNMYAGSGYFNGAIITESTVEAAEIRTAIITGTGPKSGESDYALKIRDYQGNNRYAIKFYHTEDDNTENEYFTLKSTELKLGINTSLAIGENSSFDANGVLLYTPEIRTNKTNSFARFGESNIGFQREGFYGINYNNASNSLDIVAAGKEYINLSKDTITTKQRLSVQSAFNIWGAEFVRIEKDGVFIGFDIEME